MDALASTFHIDWKLVIAQFINFAIVLVLVYFVIGKPLVVMLKKREIRIKEGLDNADEADVKLAEADKNKEVVISEAKVEAKSLLEDAHGKGKKMIDDAKNKSIAEYQEILNKAQIDIEKERSIAEESLKKDTAKLVRLSLESVLRKGFTKADTEKIMHGVQ